MNVQYEALKAYAMLNDAGHFDAAGFRVFVTSYWDSALAPPLGPNERKELGDHLDALLAAGAVGSGITLAPALVDSVRRRLIAQSGSQRIDLRLAAFLDLHPMRTSRLHRSDRRLQRSLSAPTAGPTRSRCRAVTPSRHMAAR